MVRRRYRDDDWDRDFFSDFFGDFDFDFRRINERIARMLEDLRKNQDTKILGPYVYGFTYRIGPDGKPTFQEFGNVPEMAGLGSRAGVSGNVREPLVDINEDKDHIYITYELPGVDKSDISLKVTENEVVLSAKDGDRSYQKEIRLEHEIVPDSASAKFKNGLLDVTLKKVRPTDKEGRSVRIE